jgi:serine/threonine protein phosphatase 1
MANARVRTSFSTLHDLRVKGRRPSIPDGIRIYAVGDIHGRIDLLDRLLFSIAEDVASRAIVRPVYVFLGDYIDRGPSSRQAIDRLIEHGENHECVFLKGNHELIALKCLRDRSLFDQWLRLGGLETLASYGVSTDIRAVGKQIVQLQAAFHSALPQAHLRFFRNLKNSFACGDFFFAHAGVKPGTALSRQKEEDLLWIRDEFLTSIDDFGKIIVHGHTPVGEVGIRSNRINIDTGAFASGLLTCLVIESTSLFAIDTCSVNKG